MTNKRKLSDLALDSGNANKGTERGRQAIEASIREFGFADAGTLDKHNTIIGGNKRTLAAGVIGMNEAIIIDVEMCIRDRLLIGRPGSRVAIQSLAQP